MDRPADPNPDPWRSVLGRLYTWRYANLALLLTWYAAPLAWLVLGSVSCALGIGVRSLREVVVASAKFAAVVFLIQLVILFACGLLWLRDRILGWRSHRRRASS